MEAKILEKILSLKTFFQLRLHIKSHYLQM